MFQDRDHQRGNRRGGFGKIDHEVEEESGGDGRDDRYQSGECIINFIDRGILDKKLGCGRFTAIAGTFHDRASLSTCDNLII